MKPKPPPQQPHKQKPGHYQFVEVPTEHLQNTKINSLPTNQSPSSCSTCYIPNTQPTVDRDTIVFRD